MGTTQQLKRVVNASQNLALMSMQFKEEKNRKHEMEVSLHHKTPIIVDNVLMVRRKHDMGTNLSYVQVWYSTLYWSTVYGWFQQYWM